MSVPPGFTFLLGGARSGKSALAVMLGHAWPGAVTFVATARLTGHDTNLAARVARHRNDRPTHWTTIEPVGDLVGDLVGAAAAAPEDSLVIVDCITLWVAAALDDEITDALDDACIGPIDADRHRIERTAGALANVLASRSAPSVVVSNEVGLGVHPETSIGLVFRDTLGRVNGTLAARASRTLFLAAGRAVRLDDPWALLR